MGWMNKLCEAYDAALGTTATEEQEPLVPLGFIEKNIKYLITLSGTGEFVTAAELPKDRQRGIVPTAPEAENRTSTMIAPFPLAEQLKYLLCTGGGEDPYFDAYLKDLTAWSESDGAPAYLKTLLNYLSARTLAEDLSRAISEKAVKDTKSIACFAIRDEYENEKLWERADLIESWSRISAQRMGGKAELCYVTGERLPVMDKHPKLEGNAKLISSKDENFRFQYKGRFTEDDSAVKVSALASAKAHNALRWLIARQGLRKYGMTYLAWNTNGSPVNVPLEEKVFSPDGRNNETKKTETGEKTVKKPSPDTFVCYAEALREAANSYRRRLDEYRGKERSEEERKRADEIVILCLQAATKGRLSITYYQEMPGNTYVERLGKWYRDCAWELLSDSGARDIASPTAEEIARAVVGDDAVAAAQRDYKCEKSGSKQVRELYLRLLMCITEGEPLPEPYKKQAAERVSNPLVFTDGKGRWQSFLWEQNLSVACALIRCGRIRLPGGACGADVNARVLSPAIDPKTTDRSYHFGRLLAAAHRLEQEASVNLSMPTNALRLMKQFAVRPAETWAKLHTKLLPYLKLLGKDGHSADRYQNLFGCIEAKFTHGERMDNAPLSELFLIGFYVQQRELWKPAEERITEEGVQHFTPSANRDELFGCMLAVADAAEWTAKQYKRDSEVFSERDGMTNALRYMNTAAITPNSGWMQVHDRLVPYLEMLGVRRAEEIQLLLTKLESGFDPAERCADAALGGAYLHGYYRMRSVLRHASKWDQPEFFPRQAHMSAAELPETREALFGALLALENRTERAVLDIQYGRDSDENRPSNAMRYLARVSMRPAEVWAYLEERMRPYERKHFFGAAVHTGKLKEDLMRRLIRNGWNTDERLKAEYLHYFYTFLTTKEKAIC